ncbi:MAG: aconitate hydratase AcnA [Thermoguttaceae bacterium]
MSGVGGLRDPFGARERFETGSGPAVLYRLSRLEDAGLTEIARLPFSIRVLLESALRNCDGYQVTEEHVKQLAGWTPLPRQVEVPFKPARVLLQDFTGVPAIVDLAAMRSAMHRLGADPKRINPLVPVDLVVDHSVEVDYYGSPQALAANAELELARNRQRYGLLRWAQQALENFRVVPPGVGIVHQVNLEFLAKCVFLRPEPDSSPPAMVALPDTLVGADSHTTMINGLGVLGWGVGGIEAEAVMLGQPVGMLLPEVIGVELTGKLPPGTTTTDLVLTITQMLRREGVVGKFVEYFGPGVAAMGVADRATIANMAPEYGATVGFFPIDQKTLDYLWLTGRSHQEVALVERYTKEQQLFSTGNSRPEYTKVLSLDLGAVEPCVAGPKRPHDRVPLKAVKAALREALAGPAGAGGFALAPQELGRTVPIAGTDPSVSIGHGAVVIAAITSCTNTSNPAVMLAAGLLAKKAVRRGLRTPPHVKTSLSPGSRVVADYLAKAGLDGPLAALGFHNVGYGCMTCIGNSGPLPEPVAKAIREGDLVASAVLSGNRNFEGRVHGLVKANWLASPPLVVAYALAGTVDIDLSSEPLGTGADGKPVYLSDIWPSQQEIEAELEGLLGPEMFRHRYADIFSANPNWEDIRAPAGDLYAWDPQSTYIQEPRLLADLPVRPGPIQPIRGARVLVALGDSITTDHISPAGPIAPDSPAGRYLAQCGVAAGELHSFGARRGNDRVMVRGTFDNIRLRNHLAPGTEGAVTRHLPDGRLMSVFDAAMLYQQEGVLLLVLAGREYGSGSSRDWAAKGPRLLGVRGVIASSFERIHRSNLVGVGILPMELPQGSTWQSLGLTGEETFDILGLAEGISPGQMLAVEARAADGRSVRFSVRLRIDTPVEMDYYRNGGTLQTVLRRLLSGTLPPGSSEA